MTRVTIYRKGQCWVHALHPDEPSENCLCPLQTIWQDVVTDVRATEIVQRFEASGSTVLTRAAESV